MPTNNIVRQGFRAIDVTKSDSTDITGADANNPAALYVGTGGRCRGYHIERRYCCFQQRAYWYIYAYPSYKSKGCKHYCY